MWILRTKYYISIAYSSSEWRCRLELHKRWTLQTIQPHLSLGCYVDPAHAVIVLHVVWMHWVNSDYSSWWLVLLIFQIESSHWPPPNFPVICPLPTPNHPNLFPPPTLNQIIQQFPISLHTGPCSHSCCQYSCWSFPKLLRIFLPTSIFGLLTLSFLPACLSLPSFPFPSPTHYVLQQLLKIAHYFQFYAEWPKVRCNFLKKSHHCLDQTN